MNMQMMYKTTITGATAPYLQILLHLVNKQLGIIRHAVHLVQKQTRQANSKEVAIYLGLSLDEYNHILQDVNTYRLFNSKQEVA